MEIKIFKYDSNSLNSNDIEKAFSCIGICYFFKTEGLVALHFDDDTTQRRDIVESAHEIGLIPISITRRKFLELLKNMVSGKAKITNVEFIDALDQEDRNELNSLLVEKSKDICDFVCEILGKYETFIKQIAWYDVGTDQNKITLFDSGVVFSNKNIDFTKHEYLNVLSGH